MRVEKFDTVKDTGRFGALVYFRLKLELLEASIAWLESKTSADSALLFWDEPKQTKGKAFAALCELLKAGEKRPIFIGKMSDLTWEFNSIEEVLDFATDLKTSSTTFHFFQPLESIDSNSSMFLVSLIRSFIRHRESRRSKRIRNALKKVRLHGKRLGRPKRANYIEIKRLHKEGQSTQEIANQLNISKSLVYYALSHQPI